MKNDENLVKRKDYDNETKGFRNTKKKKPSSNLVDKMVLIHNKRYRTIKQKQKKKERK